MNLASQCDGMRPQGVGLSNEPYSLEDWNLLACPGWQDN